MLKKKINGSEQNFKENFTHFQTTTKIVKHDQLCDKDVLKYRDRVIILYDVRLKVSPH